MLVIYILKWSYFDTILLTYYLYRKRLMQSICSNLKIIKNQAIGCITAIRYVDPVQLVSTVQGRIRAKISRNLIPKPITIMQINDI